MLVAQMVSFHVIGDAMRYHRKRGRHRSARQCRARCRLGPRSGPDGALTAIATMEPAHRAERVGSGAARHCRHVTQHASVIFFGQRAQRPAVTVPGWSRCLIVAKSSTKSQAVEHSP